MRRASSAAVLTAAAAVVLGAAASAASAPTYRITASMTAKQMTRPVPVGNVGSARGVLEGNATLGGRSQVAWTLRYSGLTGRVVAALVRYRNPKGVTAAISLCVKPCRSGQTSFTFFRSKSEGADFVGQVKAGKVDAVLQTKQNPGGEVRGVLKAGPTSG
jgi:hypothetical protein